MPVGFIQAPSGLTMRCLPGADTPAGAGLSAPGRSASPDRRPGLDCAGCRTRGLLLTSSGQRPETQLNILVCAGRPHSKVGVVV